MFIGIYIPLPPIFSKTTIDTDNVKRKIELLAPGGDVHSIKAAILAGADAIYCGLDKFNARNRAINISLDELKGLLILAHENDCQIFITLNIIIIEQEIPALVKLLNKLVNTSIDGIIIQDLGMFYLVSKYFPKLDIHASTQMTTHNEGQIKFLAKLKASRVNLCRELNLKEIKELSTIASTNNVLTEVFVHGSNCICFSGLCYISSVQAGNSGNRGRCSQPCRDKYETTTEGIDFPLNLKDNSAFSNLEELYNAGVASLKIEGRIKNIDYVYTTVEAWRKHINALYSEKKLLMSNESLYKVFNRDFTNSYLRGDINKDMFINNPRDNSIKHLSDINKFKSAEEKEAAQLQLYKEKDAIMLHVESEIAKVSIEKKALKISISGKCEEALNCKFETPDNTFHILSEVHLASKGAEILGKDMLLNRFNAVNETTYYISSLNLDELDSKLYIPFKELSKIKKKLLYILNDSKECIEDIKLPALVKSNTNEIKSSISILIDSEKDIKLCNETSGNTYFLIPSCIKARKSELLNLFKSNKKLIPYFQSIIIGDDYTEALDFLNKLQAEIIVTDNTGIAFEAYNKGISWIAGPYMNLVNSYSLKCLKETFNCSGAFLSNEINKRQIRSIKPGENFELHYSIYHPIPLMTSRQCLFHQVDACGKENIDNDCIPNCERTSSITSIKGITSFLEKSKGNYHHLYNETNFLNTDIIEELPNVFTSYLVDLREIKTKTEISIDKTKFLRLFVKLANGDSSSRREIEDSIQAYTKSQYLKGL
jgi:putative protease